MRFTDPLEPDALGHIPIHLRPHGDASPSPAITVDQLSLLTDGGKFLPPMLSGEHRRMPGLPEHPPFRGRAGSTAGVDSTRPSVRQPLHALDLRFWALCGLQLVSSTVTFFLLAPPVAIRWRRPGPPGHRRVQRRETLPDNSPAASTNRPYLILGTQGEVGHGYASCVPFLARAWAPSPSA